MCESGAAVQGRDLPTIARNIGTGDMFSEKGSDELSLHQPTDSAVEILLGAKLPKSKLYSLTPWELKELRLFIDKNLA